MILELVTSIFNLLLKYGLIFGFVYLLVKTIKNVRTDKYILRMEKLYNQSKVNVKKFKLKNLYACSENDFGNAVKLGKITGYAIVMEKEKTAENKKPINRYYSLFFIKTNIFGDKAIVKINPAKHNSLENGGDILIKTWNLIKKDNLYIENTIESIETEGLNPNQTEKRVINTIENIKPLIQSAIMLDSSYKKQDRMMRVMNLYDE